MSYESAEVLHKQDIEYSDGETIFRGYAVVPQTAAERHPCVLLMHDWSGLNDPTKRLAERYAGLGYICFALDLYGKDVRGDPVGNNSHLMNPLMSDRAFLRRRLMIGFEAACRFPGIDDARMAAVGYCFGGLCALDLARAGPSNLKAAVSFHGGLRTPDLGHQRSIEASILLLHGWEDPIVPPADVLAIAKEMTDADADWQLHVYGHAQHAFTFEDANFPERGVVYDHKAEERSWVAMRRHLTDAFTVERTRPS